MFKSKLTLAATISFLLASNAFAEGLTLSAGEFVQNNDGTVTHTPTGLIWQACSVGQTWDGGTGTCADTAENYSYADAMKLTSDFAGQKDWRVPNIAELHSLIDLKKSQPAVNKSLFPQTPTSDKFLSSSTYTSSPSYSWRVGFGDGEDGYNSSGYVRFVRGTTVSPIISLKDFSDNGDGTVTHTKTGLTWQRCAVGQTWNDGGCDGKSTTYTQDKAMKLTSTLGGQTDWRLPSLRELQTIVDYSAYKPSTNVIVFPDAPSVQFWTTTQMAGDYNTSYAWVVDFETGGSTYGGKTGTYSARLVRGSMTGSTAATPVVSGGVDLVPTITGMPSPATVNGNITFTATLTNKGSGTATDTKMSFGLPKNTVSLVTKPDECNFTGLSVVCSLGNVVPNGSITKAVTVKMT
ncbi:MAG: DUF1566 domain-containing protein, partial [Methylococcaceae bacterium]